MDRELAFIDEDKGPIYRYPNGDLRTAKGHWYERGKTDAPLFDSARSKQVLARRYEEKAQREATLQREARRTLVNIAKTDTPEQAVAELVGEIYKDGMSKDTKPPDKVKCGEFVVEHTGMRAAQEQAKSQTVVLNMPEGALRRLEQLARQGDVVDGEFTEE